MTISEFIGAVEGYYGPYRPAQKRYVFQYLQQRAWPPEYLAKLFAYLTKTVSCEKHFVPDIAVFVRLSARELQTPDRPAPKQLEQEVTADRKREIGDIFRRLVGKEMRVKL